ncbi:CCR4-associated factor 1-like protein 11 [Pyrus ussuriensis x Pyrus communis]|uniref:CCR4-associated factor 1-like protein 11 n=1 Tax=Pyrus ussuriensis x Pyrus communis TaxID=2448454 RepID=A0A5N5GHF2_9ROSA|nr:CCR4-associated factor 1-like protein 11 [Pyrus ussuriensis x Pyrus communis]
MDIEFLSIVVRSDSNDPNFYHRELAAHYLMLKVNEICRIWGPRICTYRNSISGTSTSGRTPTRMTRSSYFTARGLISNGTRFLVGLGLVRGAVDVIEAHLQQCCRKDEGFWLLSVLGSIFFLILLFN